MVPTRSASFLQYAELARRRIDRALDQYSRFGADCPAPLAAAIRHSLLSPGKRLRPLLVLLAAEACGGDGGQALPAACAVEMVHTYSLIHDDLPAIDDDDLRRGRPTCHVAFGEALAILAGDALLARAFELLASELTPPDAAAAACRVLARAAGPCCLVGGQADDLEAEGRADMDVAMLEAIHRRKTGALFRASLELGGLAAGAEADQLEALRRYADCVGLAFQIIDDLLDVQGDERALGKRTGQDAAHAKPTFPALLGAARSRERAEELVAAGLESLAPLGGRAEQLASLAWYVLERDR